MTVYLVLSLERYFSRIAYDSREWSNASVILVTEDKNEADKALGESLKKDEYGNTVKTSKNTMILRKIVKMEIGKKKNIKGIKFCAGG